MKFIYAHLDQPEKLAEDQFCSKPIIIAKGGGLATHYRMVQEDCHPAEGIQLGDRERWSITASSKKQDDYVVLDVCPLIQK
jgi:hypothetical protein